MRFLYNAIAAVIITGLILLALPAAAQTDLPYGTAVTGKTDASYHISGKEGDLISAEAVGISAELIPVLTLIDASGRQLVQADNDPLTPGSSTLHARLPLDGDYTLKVSGLYGKSGDFVLSLSARPISAAPALAEGRTSIRLDATPQAFHFAGPAEIHLISPNGAFSAQIHSQPGELIAEMNDLPRAVFALDSNGEYELMLRTTGASVAVEIDYLERPDLAQAVAAQITTINTPIPTQEANTSAPPTETPVPTEIPTEATLIPFPTVDQATPTATEIPVRVAPNDANYQLNLALGGTGAVSDAVSFPSGDHEDRVFFDITGLDSNATSADGRAHLIISATCSGTATETITFFAAGRLYHCGDTIVDRTATLDTRSGSILVTAASGDNTYVEWSLTGSAARAN